MSFNGDIDKFQQKVNKIATDIFRGTSIDILTRVVRRTPVDQGTARGNWFATINAPSKEIDEKIKDKNGAKSIGRVKGITRNAKLGNSIYLINNLPYIKGLEDGTGTDQPSGMVKVTVAEFKNIVDANARKNKR